MPEPTMTPQARAFLAKWGVDGSLIAGSRDMQAEFEADFRAALTAERERCADLAEFDYKHANSLTIARAIRSL